MSIVTDMTAVKSLFALGSELASGMLELACGSCLLCMGRLSKAQWCAPFDRADVV